MFTTLEAMVTALKNEKMFLLSKYFAKKFEMQILILHFKIKIFKISFKLFVRVIILLTSTLSPVAQF